MKVKLLKRVRTRLVIIPKGTAYEVFTSDMTHHNVCFSIREIIMDFARELGLSVKEWAEQRQRAKVREIRRAYRNAMMFREPPQDNTLSQDDKK